MDEVRRIQIETLHEAAGLLIGAYRTAIRGQGMEFEEVRKYQVGDEVRHIDWNVTARMRHPYVKTFTEERQLTIMLAVDLSPSMLFGSSDKSKSELMAQLAGLLAFSASKNGDKIGLIIFTDKLEKYIFPQRGSRHVSRIIRELLSFEAKGSKTDLKETLHFLGQVQKRSMVCFLLSDFLCEVPAKELATQSKHHDMILMDVVDPMEGILPSEGLLPLQDLETSERIVIDRSNEQLRESTKRAAQQRHINLREAAKSAGADYIAIRTDENCIQPLLKFFRRRKTQRR